VSGNDRGATWALGISFRPENSPPLRRSHDCVSHFAPLPSCQLLLLPLRLAGPPPPRNVPQSLLRASRSCRSPLRPAALVFVLPLAVLRRKRAGWLAARILPGVRKGRPQTSVGSAVKRNSSLSQGSGSAHSQVAAVGCKEPRFRISDGPASSASLAAHPVRNLCSAGQELSPLRLYCTRLDAVA